MDFHADVVFAKAFEFFLKSRSTCCDKTLLENNCKEFLFTYFHASGPSSGLVGSLVWHSEVAKGAKAVSSQ